MITLFVQVGITADYVLAASAIERIASYILPTILGLIAAIYYGRKIANNNSKRFYKHRNNSEIKKF